MRLYVTSSLLHKSTQRALEQSLNLNKLKQHRKKQRKKICTQFWACRKTQTIRQSKTRTRNQRDNTTLIRTRKHPKRAKRQRKSSRKSLRLLQSFQIQKKESSMTWERVLTTLSKDAAECPTSTLEAWAAAVCQGGSHSCKVDLAEWVVVWEVE